MTLSFNQELCEVRGCRITLKRCGSGPKLLYLHGANGAASVRPFMEELAKGFNVLVPEHPGFGASIGGWLALEIAVRDTSRIRALTAVGPLGIYVPGLKRGDLFLWSPEEKVRNLFFDQKIAEQMLAQPTTPEQIETEVKNQYTVARLAWEPRMFDPHLAKWLHRVRVPTQIIWGDSDRVLPAGYAADFKKLIPHARVDIVRQCGHTPHVEKPQEFVRLVREFAAKI